MISDMASHLRFFERRPVPDIFNRSAESIDALQSTQRPRDGR